MSDNCSFILYFWENGVLSRQRQIYFPAIPQCRSDQNSRRKMMESSHKKAAMKMIDFTGVFLLFGIGLGVSFLTFLLEIIVGKYWL